MKIMLKIILNRNEKKIDNEIGEMQSMDSRHQMERGKEYSV